MAALDQLVSANQIHPGRVHLVKADQWMFCHDGLELLWSDVARRRLQLLAFSGASFHKEREHGGSDHPRPVPAHSVEEVTVLLCSGQQHYTFECCWLERSEERRVGKECRSRWSP